VPLEDVVTKLRKRILNIREHKDTIGEENTKATLIEPLLAALGWDTEELTEVHREYKRKSQDKPVDYALFLLREPRLFIEAKALDEDLTNRKWASQIIGYAATAGVKWCVLTDGDEYRLFNSHAEVDIEEKLFRSIRISISGADEQAFAVQTLALLSKEKMAENLLTLLWTPHFVDRKVKGAVEDLFKNEDPGFIRLLRKKTTGLGPSEIRASLKRAVPIRIDFPVVPVTPSHIPADGEKLSPGKKAALTRKARLLTAAVDQAKRKSPTSIRNKGATQASDRHKVDTVVVPAQHDGFQETFMAENRWYAVRIDGRMRPQIKYIAVYRVAPVSAITHIAPVKSIEPWKETDKFVVNFSEPAKEIGPIPMVKRGRGQGFQNLRYTARQRLEAAKTLDDIW